MVNLVIVEAHPEAAVVCEQLVEESQAGVHHSSPFIVPQAVVDGYGVAVQPLAEHGAVDIVVITPAFIACVVRRVDEDTVHLPGVLGEKRFEGVKVVAMDDEIVIEAGVADTLVGMCHERPERHAEMVVVDELLALED